MEEKDENDIDKTNNSNISNNKIDENEMEEENQRTVSVQIDPSRQGEQKLISLNEKLRLDVPYVMASEKIDESMDLDILLYNIKDFIIMFVLLLSSSLNFNYLSLPFIFIGIFYKFLILENKTKNRNIKFIIEIIVCVYSGLLLIFKIVSIILVSKDNDYYKEKRRNIFINFGISYLISQKEKIYLVSTFIGEAIIFLFSIGAIVIDKITNITDEEIDSRYFKKMTFKSLFAKMRKYLFGCFFILSGIAVFNKSVLSLVYLLPMCLILFLYAIDIESSVIYNLFRILSQMLQYLLILEVLLINFTNIYTIAHDHFLKSNDESDFLTVWHQLGFYFAYYKEDQLSLIFEDWLGYLFSCLSIVTFSFSIKSISKHELQIAKKDDDHPPKKEEEENKNFFNKLYDKFCLLFVNPYIILHICRIMAIIWIYIFRNFYSLGIYIWLFFSFLYLHITSNEFWTKFLLIPCLSISLFSIHISRIDGCFENYEEIKQVKYYHFALGKFDYYYLRYILTILLYFFSTYFLYTINEYKREILSSPLPTFEMDKPNLIDNNINNENIEIGNNNVEEERAISFDDLNTYNENLNNDNSNAFDNLVKLDSDSNIEKKLLSSKELKDKRKKLEKEDEDLLKKENLEKVTLSNIIYKNIFENVDKFIIIGMYIVICNHSNIIHIIFNVVFLMLLLLPEVVKAFPIIIILIFQVLFLLEYIMDLSKVYNYESFENNIEKIQFCLPFDKDLKKTSIDIFIYFLIYCFYGQYQINSYRIYQQLIEDETINIKNYINIKFKNFPFLKNVLFITGTIVMNIYFWLIITLFIISTCSFEINLIFGIKLGIFLISLYFLMLFIQDPKNKKLTLKSSKIVLYYSGINTFVAYLYQIISHPYTGVKERNDKSGSFFVSNLPNIGLTKYDEDKIYLHFFPFFFNNFISLLYLWENKRTMDNNEKEILRDYINEMKTIQNNKKKKEEENNDENKENQENEKKESAAEKYQKNIDKMTKLEWKNFFFHIVMVITKFYWLFLFMIVCILFTTKYLSYGMIIYLIIFGLSFILMYYKIVKNLSDFIKKDSYFISKVIRYSLIEVKYNINQHAKSRKIAFQFLFATNCIYLFIYYLSGVFYLFENGCNPDYWEGCDPNHKPFFSESNIKGENRINSLSYLFGFYVELDDSGLLSAAWASLLLFFLIAFDVFIQKLENFFTNLSIENRKEYKILANENIKLKPLTLLGENNILANIEAKIFSNALKKAKTQITPQVINLMNKDDINKKDKEVMKYVSKKNIDYLEDKYKELFKNIENIFLSKGIKLSESEINLGKKNITQFLEIFQKASSSDVKLSETNNKYKIIKGIKQVYEEIIIFLLICTAISKLNIWSFVYMIFSLFLILSKKTANKYYFLFCFLIIAIIFQNSIFVSNIRMETDPGKSEKMISIINSTLDIPWYTIYTDDKNGFFFGLGVNRMQINLMWMDYIETIIIYIYLSFFSYSIYQDVQNKGKVNRGVDKINYYNLHLNDKVKKSVENLSLREFKKHKKCMQTDFNINIGEFEDFRNKILLIRPKNSVIELKEIKPKKEIGDYNTVMNTDISLNVLNIDTEVSQQNQNESITSKDNIDKESPLLLALEKSKNLASTKKNLITKSMETKDETTNILDTFKKIVYLSSHNIIIIIIMIISMMVSGIWSIFYIIFSLIFLMKSNSMYTGDPYYYPKSIKTVLRVAILIDIAIQTLYQTPYINPSSKDNTLNKILKIIGFNKIISFGENFNAEEFEISSDQMILVFAKAFTYFFMSIQILIYSSQDFQEYYLSYLLTKNFHLRRISLMNVFRFNNERIERMGSSITLRQEMENSMKILQKRLESWTKSLSSVGGKLYIGESKTTNKDSSDNAKEIKSKEKEEEKNKIKSLTEEEKRNALQNLKTLTDFPKELEINKNKEKNKDEEEQNVEKKGAGIKFLNLLGVKLNEEESKEEEKYVPENIVKEHIKGWIFGGIIMRIQLWLHKNAASYTSIEVDERDVYEKEVIQGRTTISSMLETMVEMQLNTIDLSKFTSEELIEVKKYFDGTREKELKRLKQEKEKREKLQKNVKKVIALNKLKLLKDKKNEKEEDISDKKKEEKEKMQSFYDDIKLKEKENKKNKIDLTQPKFIELEKFTSNELFVKYLKTNYIIKCILTDIIAFCSNKFHWLCYIMMIIDHMCFPSLLSLFYPLSIFLYAILEYPRPKKIYWNICLLYTVLIITIKYIVQLQLFVEIFDKDDIKETNPYKDFIIKLEHYKLGLKFYDSTFSVSFFNYIVYDSLVIIFLLINNYLLLSKGIWIKREQEIENIYQAMERIASTKHLNLQTIEETKAFNTKWLFHSLINRRSTRKTKGLFSKKYSTSGRGSKKEKKEEKETEKKEEIKTERKTEIEKEFKEETELEKEIGSKTERVTRDRKASPSFYKKLTEIKKERASKIKDEKRESQIMKPVNLENYDEMSRTYFQRLFPKIRNEKPGNQYYSSYTIAMLFIIFFLILFYTNMNQDKTFNSVSVDTNQFSSSMVLFLIVHVIFLFYDRVIFISQNRNNIIYDYIIYDKKTCAPISEVQFNQIKSEISLKYNAIKRDKFFIPSEYLDEIKDKYNIVYIQNEEFNLPLLQKYILHLVITIFAHGFIFFYLPMKGNINIGNAIYCIEGEDCNDFTYNPALIIFYCLYVVYLMYSGLQVKYGFYDLRRKSLLKSGNSSISGGIYAAYKAIPFLYEIKLAIDWTFTSTCLDLFQWNKYESVYDTIYSTYCSMTAKNEQLVGQPVKKYMKAGMGGTLSFALIFLLVIPIMLFSSLNPTNEVNNLSGANLKIDLALFYQNGATKNYTLYQNSKPESIKNFFPEEENEWSYYKYSESTETKNFPHDQIQKVEFFQQSDRNWGLTKPHIKKLIETLGHLSSEDINLEISKIFIVMDYEFERLLPVEAKKVSNRVDLIIYDDTETDNDIHSSQKNKIKEIKNVLTNCDSETKVSFENLYSVPHRLTANVNPRIIYDEKYQSYFNYNVTLGFVGCEIDEDDETEINYLESYFTLEKGFQNETSNEGVVFHVFSDKVSSTMSGYSVLTFYVSFVLLAGTYVRNFFSGAAEQITLTELPNPEALINLCEGVLVSRYSYDYEQEEKLYYILMELMRSPDYLKILTESSIEQFKKRRDHTIQVKNANELKIE